MKRLSIISWLVYALFVAGAVEAQPMEQYVKVIVAPDLDNWTYKSGEKVTFSVSVLQSGNLVKNAKIQYEIGPEKIEPFTKDSTVLAKGETLLDGGTLKTGGFLRCVVVADVEGKKYRGLATAGFDPAAITPTVENPADFTRFWEEAKAEAAKIPIDAEMTLLPERC
ncbi:MAG: acetylxylan esterase, partial [Cyclobacteriaceae bacterium]